MPHLRPRRIRGTVSAQLTPLVSLIALATTVAACASAGSFSAGGHRPADGGAPAIRAVPTTDYALAAATLPLTAYALSQQDLLTIRNAGDILVQRCMQAKGFAYPVTLASSQPAPQTSEPYGITSATQAASYGYTQPGSSSTGSDGTGSDGTGSGSTGPAASSKLPSLTQLQQQHGLAYIQALFGNTNVATGTTQANACINANKPLFDHGSQATSDLDLVGELTTQSEQLTESDSRVVEVERAWARCMKSKGFDFATPMAAQAAAWPSAPDSTEIATTEADVQCKTKTNLPGIWLAVEAAYQRRLISGNESQIAELRIELQAEVERAAALLRGKQS
jgi:hypothetical protein